MRPIRIALSGKMRSGKDTLASELIVRHGFTRMAFADRLKELARDLFRMEETDKNRALLQELGRRLCQVDPAVWINYATARMPLHKSVVVTDLRFPNEWHALKGLGFLMVRVEIDAGAQRARFKATESKADYAVFEALRDDPSECLLDTGFKWDLVVNGDEGASQMYGEVRLLLEHMALTEETS